MNNLLTEKNLQSFKEAEEACVCKHCGRCVLAGPPCCYDNLYEMYQKLENEVMWLRKVQGKKDKLINELKKQLEK